MFTITPASPADVPAAAAVLGEAFRNDAVMAAIMGRPQPTAAELTALFLPIVRSAMLRHRRLDLARRATDGAILGVALWESPGAGAHLAHQVMELPAFLRALGLTGILHAARLQANLASHRPAEPHWFLATLGVSAQARGAGVGSALLASRLATIDAAGESAYLESSNERNRSLYRRNGFETISTIMGIPRALPAAMWRPAGVPTLEPISSGARTTV